MHLQPAARVIYWLGAPSLDRIELILPRPMLPKGWLRVIARPVNRKHCWSLLILANGRALAQSFGAPPILLLDEVAAHLDADRRAALYDEICALGAQAFMTGTGPELFAELGDRASHFEVSDVDGTSHVREVLE